MKNNSILVLIYFILHTAISSCTVAQNQYSVSNKKAIKVFEEGYNLAMKREDDKAIKKLEEALKIEPRFAEAYALLGEIYLDKKDYVKAEQYYTQLIELNEKRYAVHYSTLGDILMKQQKFREAARAIGLYLEKAMPKKALADKYMGLMRKCEVAAFLMEHPVPFTPINLGDQINSASSEYHPSMPADGSFMIYTVREKSESAHCRSMDGTFEDFYISYQGENGWTLRKNLGPPVNSDCNEGAANVSPDGRFMFFAANNRKMRDESMDIYLVEKKGNAWSVPVNLEAPINTDAFESQPSFSSDGKTLYFVSNRPGGLGGNDIWYSIRQADGTWSNPVNLGAPVNTAGNEISPFIHPDGSTLYFCSDGHEGMGGYDFFVARKDPSTNNFGEPVNLGYPINTVADERSLIISADGTRGYFASNQLGGMGQYDLYMFEIPQAVRPKPVTYLKGKVLDRKTRVPLQAQFQLIDVQTGNVIVESSSDPVNGEFLVSIPPDKRYALNVNKQGYLFFSESYDVKANDSLRPFLVDIPLQPIEVGGAVVLKNVYFNTDKYDLLNESKAELNKLAELLRANPTMKIEIGGHTDNIGNKTYNQKLSENRAKAVYDYLILQGIAAARLSYKGYGDTMPIADNATEQGRALNRRTEFKVTAK